jgi:hypothetical protein
VLALAAAGNVVLNSKFYEDTSGNILNEICECPCCFELRRQQELRASPRQGASGQQQQQGALVTAVSAVANRAAVLAEGAAAHARNSCALCTGPQCHWTSQRCDDSPCAVSVMLTVVFAPLTAAGKEYSKADSRYATRDDFVISMEAVTAFLEGPGCLLICWAMLKCKPWRFTAILLVSLGQLYGDVLYFGTCLHGGELCSRQV